jgi:hypothetical protein
MRPWTPGDAHEPRTRIDTEAWTFKEAFLVTTHRFFIDITATLPYMDVYVNALDEAVRAARAEGAIFSDRPDPGVRHGIEYATPAGANAAQLFIFGNAPPANHAWVRMLQTAPYNAILDWIGSGAEMLRLRHAEGIVARHVNQVVRRAKADGLTMFPGFQGTDPLEVLMNGGPT